MPQPQPAIFRPQRRRAFRARAARRFSEHDFLHRRAMFDIVERLEMTTRDFPRAAFFGVGALDGMLTPACGVGEIVHADNAAGRLAPGRASFIADEERNPCALGAFDLVVSLLTLHAVDDLVGALTQWRLALKPDGLLIAALFGEETLAGLRTALFEAESAHRGGASPRVHPCASIQSLGQALQRAGFSMPVVDCDSVRVRYGEPMRLFADLRGMGEQCALAGRRPALNRAILADAAARLAAQGGAQFDIVYLTGWAPHPKQPRPLEPGSARTPLKDALKTFE